MTRRDGRPGSAIAGTLLLAAAPTAILAPVGAQTQAVEEAELLASDGSINDRFGFAVGVDGDLAVVGAIGDDVARGAAYVFARGATGWTQEAKLRGGGVVFSDQFGLSIAVDGDTFVAGALDDRAGTQSGSAYVFRRTAGVWSQEAELFPDVPQANQWFGWALALDGDTAAVGAPRENGWFGAVYLFERSGMTWTRTARVAPTSDYVTNGSFGRSVALDATSGTLVVGAPGDSGGTGRGAVFVFVRTGTDWVQQQKIVAADGEQGDSLGASLALDGDRILAGAPLDDHSEQTGAAGSAYVFERAGTVWATTAKLVARDVTGTDQFGTSVALDGDRAFIGAYQDDDVCTWDPECDSGAVYVYELVAGSWREAAKLTASDAAPRRRFGHHVALSGDTLVVGTDTGPQTNVGPGWAYVFRDVAAPFESFCDGEDGAHAACPCANAGLLDAGCDNGQATGGVRLQVTSFVPDEGRARLLGVGYPYDRTPTVVVLRSAAREPVPAPFGDGVRCVGAEVVRFGAAFAWHGTSSHVARDGAGPGTFHYQAWYRNGPEAFCDPTAAWNLSNALSIAWP